LRNHPDVWFEHFSNLPILYGFDTLEPDDTGILLESVWENRF